MDVIKAWFALISMLWEQLFKVEST